MRRPLTVRERFASIELVDAAGGVVASQQVRDWSGAPENCRLEIARANFAFLAAAANASPEDDGSDAPAPRDPDAEGSC